MLGTLQRNVAEFFRRIGIAHRQLPHVARQGPQIDRKHFAEGAEFAQGRDADGSLAGAQQQAAHVDRMRQQIIRGFVLQPVELPVNVDRTVQNRGRPGNEAGGQMRPQSA